MKKLKGIVKHMLNTNMHKYKVLKSKKDESMINLFYIIIG